MTSNIKSQVLSGLFFLLLSCATQAALLHADDDAALVSLYNATGGASWTNSSGWSGTAGVMDDTTNPPFGITFDVNGRVSVISLEYNNLIGDLSAVNLSAMTGLSILIVPGNNLGSLPVGTFLPSALRSIAANSSQLSGSLPDYSSLNLLYVLSLSNNQFTGSIPDYSSNTALNTLYLNNNQLSDALPIATALPSSVVYLDLSFNQLTGSVPNYSSLSALNTLYLDNNLLNGVIPDATLLPTALKQLSLSVNQFTGSLPDYSDLTALQELSLDNNQLSGSIPDYSSLSLQQLALDGNQLTGSLPTAAQLSSTLTSFNASNNQLSGSIPDYNSLSGLQYLYLANNQLSGSLPLSSVLPTSLYLLDFSDNDFTGTLPDYSTIASLTFFQLSNLNIQGPTPAGMLAEAYAYFTTTPAIDPALEGQGVPAAITSVTGTGGELGTSATVTLYLDGVAVGSPVTTGGVGEWSASLDMTGKAEGAYVLTAISTFADWPTYPYSKDSDVVSTAVTVYVDSTAPVLTLLGDDPMIVTRGNTFTDPGVTVTDNVDTNPTVTVTGTVDTSTVGSYILTYNATDAAGNAATVVTRTVNVVAPSSSGGGGSLDWVLLLMMSFYFTMVWQRVAK